MSIANAINRPERISSSSSNNNSNHSSLFLMRKTKTERGRFSSDGLCRSSSRMRKTQQQQQQKTTAAFYDVGKRIRRRGRGSKTMIKREINAFVIPPNPFWSQDDELRKRFKQLATFVADELAISLSAGNKKKVNVRQIRKVILFIAEYPLIAAGVLIGGIAVAAAAASAVALPIAFAFIGTLLPLIAFASFGAVFAATAVMMVMLTVLGPFILSFSMFSGFGFVAIAAKMALIVPVVFIGSIVWAIGTFGTKNNNKVLANDSDDSFTSKLKSISSSSPSIDDDDKAENEFAREIIDRFDRQLLGDVSLWDTNEVSAWLKSEALDQFSSRAIEERLTGKRLLEIINNNNKNKNSMNSNDTAVEAVELLLGIQSVKDKAKLDVAINRLKRLANVKL